MEVFKRFKKAIGLIVIGAFLVSQAIPPSDSKCAEKDNTVKKYAVLIKNDEARKLLNDASRIADTTSFESEKDDVHTLKLTEHQAEDMRTQTSEVVVEPDILLEGAVISNNDRNVNSNSSIDNNKSIEKKFEQSILKTENRAASWNLDLINVSKTDYTDKTKKEKKANKQKVKVAIVDSGIDFSSDIDVAVRKNFIPGEETTSVLYEDGSGHGTSVAGIIAAKNNEEGITGVNENVELYSAKVLDENNQAPLSRVVEAINWAIDKNVNIINLSLGVNKDSEILHSVIKKATDAGILVVCAAGNGESIEYPAAYNETLSVGSVDVRGNQSDFSAEGVNLDVVAPGEKIESTSAFDGVMRLSGTSLAAPHVTGVAALLWEKNTKVPADFIKKLICKTARKEENKATTKYGNGIVDYKFASECFDNEFKEYKRCQFLSSMNKTKLSDRKTDVINVKNKNVSDNDNNKRLEKDVIEEVELKVEGLWEGADHEGLATLGNITGNDLKVLKRGAKLSDYNEFGVGGIKRYPYLHGYYTSNYIGSYVVLTQMAVAYKDGNYKDPTDAKGMSSADFKALKKIVGGGINGHKWADVLGSYKNTDWNKALIVYGMALHNATDVFAHSTTVNDKLIGHPDADKHSDKYYPNRYTCAKEVAKEVLKHIKNKAQGNVSDFSKAGNVYKKAFKVIWLSKYAKSTNKTKYNENKSAFDKMTNDSYK